MRFLYCRVVAVLRSAALMNRPLRLVTGAMAIATLAILSSRALPTSADLPFTVVYGVNPAPFTVTSFEVGCPTGICYGPSFAVAQALATTGINMPLPVNTSMVIAQPLQFVPQSNPVTVSSEAVAPVVGQTAGSATDSPPDSCWDYDSWCAYCTFHTSPECTAYPPGKKPASPAASSTTPGVGSPSTTPAGSSPAPVGGGGTSGGGGAAPYTPPR